jgi:hypothetical protein
MVQPGRRTSHGNVTESRISPRTIHTVVRNGKIGGIIERVLDAIKPETVYFTEEEGKRGGIFVVDVQDPADVPCFAEPLFLNFEASCTFRVLMNPEDLRRSGLDELGKMWS